MRQLLLVAGAVCVAGLAACSDNDAGDRSKSRGDAAYYPAGSAATGKASDGEILAAVNAVNDNEIDAAAVALNKKITPAVLEYARMLSKDHNENRAKCMLPMQETGAGNMMTDKSRMTREKGAQTLSELRPKEGAEFEQAFLAAMVKGHEDALASIDNELMPKARSAAVRDHLNATRQSVMRHRDMAKNLQGGMLMMTR